MLSNLNKLGPWPGAGPRRRGARRLRHQQEKLLTHGDRTMMDVWQQEAGDGGGASRTERPAANCSMRARACVGR